MDATAALRDRINPLLHDISLAAERELPAYSYFMVNVPTVDREPLAQLDLLLAADHLQDIREAQTGYGGTTVAFIADGFRAVGKETPAAAERYLERGPGRAERKQDVLSTAADTLGVHLEDVVTTADVWSDQSYWNRLR
ncbi:MAG: hypothetical protein SVU88_00890, partial [Candidatus Nanohaloarchaea archaeon]|nr:hypothetical protein [Candidatus Nanohaloarchaea archaeon]